MQLPFSLPDKFTAGDSLALTATVPDYPASDGWALSFALVLPDKLITITSSASGDDHVFSLAPADTLDWTPGTYAYQGYMTKGSTDRVQIQDGLITIRPNLAVQSAGYDALPACFKRRDALEAAFYERASETQLSIAIGGRQISEMDHAAIADALDRAKNQCNTWLRQNRKDRGQPTGGKIKVAFNG